MNECEICHQEKPYALTELPGPGNYLACKGCAGRDEWERARFVGEKPKAYRKRIRKYYAAR
jgi:hypothetical protein